jgi:SAM-dependent methyltransferase
MNYSGASRENNQMKKNPDQIWREIRASSGQNKQLIDDLFVAVVENIEMSKLSVMVGHVKKLTKGKKNIRILDYGCGGGLLLTYLRILGYKNIIGVDVRSYQSMNQLNILHGSMGLGSDTFFTYDGTQLPFNDASFDVIISQQVLEHVQNVDSYFLECKRVLFPKGKMLLDFPHRLVPFDTHTRMWFVHYFPPTIRNIIYDKYGNSNSEYYEKLLNLHPIWYYKILLGTMFSSVNDVTCSRISNFSYQSHYEGNIVIRSAISSLFNTPLVGKYINKFLSIFFNATLIVSK